MATQGRMTHNPLFLRLTRNARWPLFRLSFWLAFGLGLLCLALSCWAFLRLPSTRALCTGLLLVPTFLYLLAPLIVAPTAAVMVARDTGNEQDKLLRLTELSSASVVRGYFLAALHRLRILLILLVGLMPALVVGVLYFWLELEVALSQLTMGYCLTPELCKPVWNVPGDTLFSLVVTAGSWGLTLLAASLGTWLAFLFRSPGPAAVLAFSATLLAMLGHSAMAIIIPYEWTLVSCALRAPILLLPYGLTILFLNLARRRVERTPEK